MSLIPIENRTFKITVPDEANSFVLPVSEYNICLCNVGANAVEISFANDNQGDHFTLMSGKSIQFKIKPGETVYTNGVGGASDLEIISW